MYHFIVRRIIRNGFKELSKGNYEAVLRLFSPEIDFKFAGDHALSAELHGVDATRLWFQRIFRIFPGIQFKTEQVIIGGFPWDTEIATHLHISAVLPDGRLYENQAMQILRLKWGRAVTDDVLEDTQKLVSILDDLARMGVTEAKATPIRTGLTTRPELEREPAPAQAV